MKTLTKICLAVLAASAATPAFAKTDTQYWQTLQATAKISDKAVVSNELVIRSGDAKGFYELENSLLLGYKLDKNVTVYAGWVANPLYNKGAYNTMENRFRAQVAFDRLLMVGKAKLSGRFRGIRLALAASGQVGNPRQGKDFGQPLPRRVHRPEHQYISEGWRPRTDAKRDLCQHPDCKGFFA